jgi:hypothetical protein
MRKGRRSAPSFAFRWKLLLDFGVPAVEPFDAPRRIHDTLLTGKEWVTDIAYVEVHGGLGRTSLDFVPARAMDRRFDVLRMD